MIIHAGDMSEMGTKEQIIDFINSGISGQTTGIGRNATLIGQLRAYDHDGAKPLYPAIDAPV